MYQILGTSYIIIISGLHDRGSVPFILYINSHVFCVHEKDTEPLSVICGKGNVLTFHN